MSRRRALIVCPGRGSYARSSLGQLANRSPEAEAILDACDAYRSARQRRTVRELDAAEGFRGGLHVAGEHASLLTAACGLADLAELDREHYEVVGVVGNSLGFYTALAASGALPLADAIHLIETMGQRQRGRVVGGQLLYPRVCSDWQPSSELEQAIEQALRLEGAHLSIDLGSYAVLGVAADALEAVQQALPPVQRGSRTLPLRLPLHSAFHTPLMEATAQHAQLELSELRFGAPQVPLVDGRGHIYRPRWADSREMAHYTLGHQITRPFLFACALRTALRHTGAEVVITLGPGNSLGGPVAWTLIDEGWSGLRSREAFDRRQGTEEPLLLSMGVSTQRELLVRE